MNNLVALAIGGAPGTARAASAATKELAPTSKPGTRLCKSMRRVWLLVGLAMAGLTASSAVVWGRGQDAQDSRSHRHHHRHHRKRCQHQPRHHRKRCQHRNRPHRHKRPHHPKRRPAQPGPRPGTSGTATTNPASGGPVTSATPARSSMSCGCSWRTTVTATSLDRAGAVHQQPGEHVRPGDELLRRLATRASRTTSPPRAERARHHRRRRAVR